MKALSVLGLLAFALIDSSTIYALDDLDELLLASDNTEESSAASNNEQTVDNDAFIQMLIDRPQNGELQQQQTQTTVQQPQQIESEQTPNIEQTQAPRVISFNDLVEQEDTQEENENRLPTLELTQGTTRFELRENPDIDFTNSTRFGVSVEQINRDYCLRAEEIRSRLRASGYGFRTPEFRAINDEAMAISKLCELRIVRDDDDQTVGIIFENNSANAINPWTENRHSQRIYRFNFEERSKQNINLRVTDNSGLTRRMSHDLLESTFIFLPRLVLPYVEVQPGCDASIRRLHLPTDEIVEFSAITGEILNGVLSERPIDIEPNRHRREFAGIEYSGNGIVIRADRRAGTPEHNYNTAFNINERTSEAIVTHQGKVCYVPKSMIWINFDNANEGAYFKYTTDQEFLDVVANGYCEWNITMDDIL